ncbi:hypothetical protein AGABI1DRAFT_114495 [Agaricus bisporus var. burnettii JB137-S8]|uniref:Fe2OG dioxygenase domain-containing protein n=1 Tax=Agaricus bisporus var. burnettii (strain JB137-S8 / ATCC MYA-4627 / FGSC 10392) TaxID=597362 RepID=K5X7K4_AGABU|nr:uncharacterized protein AGABI1DRAFT_114495 [Agaricus bisporus var. burnettii JB137-S8]EKM78967.1 hypothetical protein AGABI1DRAFT_114495 [Agaricus bisporus var. burnettii JB137-S8]
MEDLKRNPHLVKTVNFEPFLDGSNKQAVADALLSSFKNEGFVYLVNHGLPQEKIDTMFEMSKAFFEMPHAKKMQAPHPASGAHHRGYSAPGSEKIIRYDDNEKESDPTIGRGGARETFDVGSENDEGMPNIWLPEETLPGFKRTCVEFFSDCFEVEKNVLRALAVGFRLPEDYFVRMHTKPDNQLRLAHYPSVATKPLLNDEISRIDAHSDFGSITLLFQDDVGGLEVQDLVSGVFEPVLPVPGSILINAGDFLMRWSNDTIQSTKHRVQAPPSIKTDITPDRYSIPYFCCPDFDTVVDCIPGTWSVENPKKYEPQSVGAYILARLAAAY